MFSVTIPPRLSTAIILSSLLLSCSADRRHPRPIDPTTDVSVEDGNVRVERSDDSSSDQDDGSTGVEAAHPVIIETRRLDVHRTVRFVASVTRANIMVVGGSMDELSLHIEAANGTTAIADLALQTGLETRSLRELTLLGQSGSFNHLEDQRYGDDDDDRAVDVDFCLADASIMLGLFSDIGRVRISGTIDGAATIFARAASSTAMLDILLSLSGALVVTDGPTRLPSGASLPLVVGWSTVAGNEGCPQVGSGSSSNDRMVLGSCVSIEAFEFRAVALIVGREPIALLVPRDGAPGPWQGIIVRRGHFVGQPRFAPSGEASTWRVESIEHHSLRLVLVTPTMSGAIGEDAPRITLPLASPP